jgi:hypothetical protein
MAASKITLLYENFSLDLACVALRSRRGSPELPVT